MPEIIGIKNCNTIKNTFSWFEENGIEYTFRDVKKDPLTPNELAEFVGKVGLETLINKKGRKWKMLGLADKNLSDNDLFDVLLEHQTMIKRPVINHEGSILVGFDEESFQDFLEIED